MRPYNVLVFGQRRTNYLDTIVIAETLADAIDITANDLAYNLRAFGQHDAEIYAISVSRQDRQHFYRACYGVNPLAGEPGFCSFLPDTDAMIHAIYMDAARERHPSNPYIEF